MPPTTPIEMIEISRLLLDAENHRFGRHFVNKRPSQEDIRKKMEDWTLDELAISFIENGFWPQEALIVLDGDERLIVLEGNRRLAALQMLHEAVRGDPVSPKWRTIADSAAPEMVSKLHFVPCIKVGSRRDVQAYLGFRHVTGIKQWAPAEKAAFITYLIEEEDLEYEEVMRRIGSKTPTVSRQYIAYCMLRQIAEGGSGVPMKKLENRFSVMYLSLRSPGTQEYLKIDIGAKPVKGFRPVPATNSRALEYYAHWLFGTDEQDPLFRDSRQTDKFGEILGSEEAVAYLKTTTHPVFEVAARLAGTEESELVRHVEKAAYEVEEALRVAHQHKGSHRLEKAVERLGGDVMRLLELFPALHERVVNES